MELKYSVQKDVIKTGNVACVQTSPISFVAHGNKGNRRHLHAGSGNVEQRTSTGNGKMTNGKKTCFEP